MWSTSEKRSRRTIGLFWSGWAVRRCVRSATFSLLIVVSNSPFRAMQRGPCSSRSPNQMRKAIYHSLTTTDSKCRIVYSDKLKTGPRNTMVLNPRDSRNFPIVPLLLRRSFDPDLIYLYLNSTSSAPKFRPLPRTCSSAMSEMSLSVWGGKTSFAKGLFAIHAVYNPHLPGLSHTCGYCVYWVSFMARCPVTRQQRMFYTAMARRDGRYIADLPYPGIRASATFA